MKKPKKLNDPYYDFGEVCEYLVAKKVVDDTDDFRDYCIDTFGLENGRTFTIWESSCDLYLDPNGSRKKVLDFLCETFGPDAQYKESW